MIFLGDAATLEDSNSFALYDSGETFGEENVLGLGAADAIIVDPAPGLIRGNNIGPIDSGFGFDFTSAIQLEPVPEPSTTFLSILAVALSVTCRRSRADRAS